MTTLMGILEGTGVFLLGIGVRLLLALAVVLVIAVPVLMALEAWKRLAGLRHRVLGLTEVAGLAWRSGIYYSSGHTWLKGGRRALRLGVDGLAQRLLAGVRSVTLPEPGRLVRRGETLVELELDGGRTAIPAPLDGRVARVNASLRQRPGLVESDPYLGGWLVEFEPEAVELGRFVRGEAARAWFRSEEARLARFCEHDLGLAAADGGEFLLPPIAALSKERRRELTDSFLRAV